MPRARAGWPQARALRGQGAGSRGQAGQGGRHPGRGDAGRGGGGRAGDPRLRDRRPPCGAAAGRAPDRRAAGLYAAVLTDVASKGPLILAAGAGGIDVEELAARARTLWSHPGRHPPRHHGRADRVAPGAPRATGRPGAAEVLARLYRNYADHDLERVEVDPLALAADDAIVALDCKLVLDEAAAARRRSSPPWPARSCGPAQAARAGRRAAPDRARWRRRRAGERRRAHHGHHGRGPPRWRRARQLPRDRRRGLPPRPAGAGTGADQPEGAQGGAGPPSADEVRSLESQG